MDNDTRYTAVPSRIPVAGRSLHRWLVGIPVVLYAATVVFFGLYQADPHLMWLRDGFLANLVAVIAAALVAIPGLLDLRAIPANHPARIVGLAHMSIHVVGLGLFVSNLFMHLDVMNAALNGTIVMERGFDGAGSLAVTAVGLGFVVVAGGIGVLLATRYRVGEAEATSPLVPRHH